MKSFALEKLTRRQLFIASIHVATLVGTIAFAWTRDGPPSETVFWAVLVFFCEIALMGMGEMIVDVINRRRDLLSDADESLSIEID